MSNFHTKCANKKNMKKEYVCPLAWSETCLSICIICDSGVSGSGGVDAGYGGVDTGGTKDPNAKLRDDEIIESVNDNSVWTDGLW